MSIHEQIKEKVESTPVVLFMKGTPDFPQCGFSSRVVQILGECDVKFDSVNVLENDEIRQGIKDYANWPTIPQLYIKGQFIGGCDIISDMFTKGELQSMLTA